MKRRTMHTLFGTAAGVCGVACVILGLRLHEALRINSAVSSAQVTAADSSDPQARLARALSLARAGRFSAAMKSYKLLLDAPENIRLAALYDLGNLNMREALKNGPGEAQRALPLIELAKQSYRDVLETHHVMRFTYYVLIRTVSLGAVRRPNILEE